MATIRKRTRKWQVLVRRQGLYISRSFNHLKDAQTWAREMELQADRRGLPPDPKVLERVTLSQLVHRYSDTVTPLKRTAATERIILKAFLRRSICSRRLSELRTADFVTYRDDRLKEIKPSSLARELTPIRHMFEVARKEWGLPIINPLTDLSIPNSDPKRERRLKAGELQLLIEATQGSRNPLLVSILLFALVTGMRRGEILALRWLDIDRDARSILIPSSKTGHARIIPLLPEAVRILDGLPANSDRVFPLTANALRLAWQRLRSRAKLSDLHFHDLRHEAISRFFEAGLSTPEVALISGHRDARMLFRYTHPMRTLIISKLAGKQVLSLAPRQKCFLPNHCTYLYGSHDIPAFAFEKNYRLRK
jgi:integrase